MNDKESHRRPVPPQPENNSVGVPLFHAAWLFALGILAAHYLWLRPAWLLIALAPLAILSALAAFRAQRILWLPLAVLWCGLGVWCAEMQSQPAPDAWLAASPTSEHTRMYQIRTVARLLGLPAAIR